MDIIENAKQGNQTAFNQLIEENKYKIYKTAKSILKNEDDVCDAIQESLIRAYNNIHKLQNNEFFSTWLIRIVINKCYDIAKTNQKKNSKIIDIQSAKEIETYDTYNESSLDQVLKQLDEDLRTVTVLYYYDDISTKDISTMLDIPEGTVKSRLSRAREKLYNLLKKEDEQNAR